MSGVGRPGTGTLEGGRQGGADDHAAADAADDPEWDEAFDIGSDTLTGVNDADYQPPFPLTAKLDKLTIKVDRPTLSADDIKKLEGAQATAVDGTPLTRIQAGPQ